MSDRRALVLGGTGMLAGLASWLVRDGWLVVLPSRRYSPLPDVDQGPSESHGKALWVEARWERPLRLARDAAKALGGPADLLVCWVHGGYRLSVLDAVAPLLADGAPVVEVHGESVGDPLRKLSETVSPLLAGHPMHQVVLGYVREGTQTRWLTHTEVVDGVLVAVKRALEDAPVTEHHVGELKPWPPGVA